MRAWPTKRCGRFAITRLHVPCFCNSHWETYRAVNEKFAESVVKIVGERKAVVFVQDYHFALLPRMIKARCPQAVCAQFWHIPWPPPELFGVCPWKKELLDGMLGNDLLGFHVQEFCNNFLETVERELETGYDPERAAVVRNGRSTQVLPFPISVDFEAISRGAESEPCVERMESLRRELRLADRIMLFGIDRPGLHEGHPRPASRRRPSSRAISGVRGEVGLGASGIIPEPSTDSRIPAPDARS